MKSNLTKCHLYNIYLISQTKATSTSVNAVNCEGKVVAVAAGAVGAVALAPVALGAVGFTSGGVAAGSFAAGMMSSAAAANGGGVAAGSLVAALQSAVSEGSERMETVKKELQPPSWKGRPVAKTNKNKDKHKMPEHCSAYASSNRRTIEARDRGITFHKSEEHHC